MSAIDDFHYALEQTVVIQPPERRLSTFSVSMLSYYLVTEDLDAVNVSRVREGSIEAARPQIITPGNFSKLMLEGFGEQAERLAAALSERRAGFLKYGFTVKKSDLRTYEAHEPVDAVIARVKGDVAAKHDPLSVIIKGVDDAWEVCLLKFMMDLVGASGEKNLRDLRERGLL
ncbi:MAG: hypothetical protein LBK60_10275 [Verrucomicrobiales bacterium]|jgi:hypothetical protein|nr:hypothetical protein [Verrucomicrobiales bacterium]